jgi:hypothetical protein
MTAYWIDVAFNVMLAIGLTGTIYNLRRLSCIHKAHKQRLLMFDCVKAVEELDVIQSVPYRKHIDVLVAWGDPWRMYGDLGQRGKAAWQAGKRFTGVKA